MVLLLKTIGFFSLIGDSEIFDSRLSLTNLGTDVLRAEIETYKRRSIDQLYCFKLLILYDFYELGREVLNSAR